MFYEILEIATAEVPAFEPFVNMTTEFASMTQSYCYERAYRSQEVLTSTDVRWGGSPPWHSWQTVDGAIVDRKWRHRDPENDSQMNRAMGRKSRINTLKNLSFKYIDSIKREYLKTTDNGSNSLKILEQWQACNSQNQFKYNKHLLCRPFISQLYMCISVLFRQT